MRRAAGVLQLVIDNPRPSLLPLLVQTRNLGALEGSRAGHYSGVRRGRRQGFLLGLVAAAVVVAVAVRLGVISCAGL